MSDQYTAAPRKPGRPSSAEIAAREAASEERARPDRAEEVQTGRRRRSGLGPERNLKLAIPNKDPNYEYRWVNDRPGRVQQLTVHDDWDKAPETMAGAGLGSSVTERNVDSYTGERAVLLRKRKEFYDADKAEEAKALDARDEAMRRGPLPTPENAVDADKQYVPGGRNIVNGR